MPRADDQATGTLGPVTIVRLTRLAPGPAGQPRWRVVLSDSSELETETGAPCASNMQDPRHAGPVMIDLRKGKICGVRPQRPRVSGNLDRAVAALAASQAEAGDAAWLDRGEVAAALAGLPAGAPRRLCAAGLAEAGAHGRYRLTQAGRDRAAAVNREGG